MRPITQALAIAGVSAVALASFAGTAHADGNSTPADTAIVAVGSDTIQFLADQFQNDAVGTPSNFFSYDATPANNITPKQGCAAITRPNGSGAGIKALALNARPSGDTTDYCLDVARASRVAAGPGSAAPDPTGLAFVPIAGDAITYSTEDTTNVPTALTTKQLNAIYSCDDTALGGTGSPVTEDEIGGSGTDAVVPVLPQSSSGTRATFLAAIGLPGGVGLGTCVVNGANPDNTVIEENEGSNEIFSRSSSVSTPDIVFPYSIGVYLSESIHGHSSSINNVGPLNLEKTNGVSPTSGSGSKEVINKKAPIQRQLFFVVRSTGVKGSYVPAYLQTFIGTGNKASKSAPAGAVCSKTAAKDDAAYGFLSLGKSCGVITTADLT